MEIGQVYAIWKIQWALSEINTKYNMAFVYVGTSAKFLPADNNIKLL